MSAPRIQDYRFGFIIIDGQSYSSDVIVHPQGVEPGWWRAQGHILGLADLKPILDRSPEIVVVGTGASGMLVVPEETLGEIRRRNIRSVVEGTERACQIYNELSPLGRTVAALHLTC
jgi:hypothetical protein